MAERRRERRPREIGLISREPVLAKILAQRRPILIGEEGYYWLVSWLAKIGAILRSEENIAYNIVMMVDYVAMDYLLSLLEAVTGLKVLGIMRRKTGRVASRRL